MKSVAVVIPALHRADLTRRCLEFLGRQTISVDNFDIIVVENDARPESSLTGTLEENVRQILLDRNYGTAGAYNRGIANSSSKYVLLLNNDVELDPRFIELLMQELEQGPQEMGFVTGKLLQEKDPKRLDGAGDALLLGGGGYRLGHGALDNGSFDCNQFVLAGCGAATLFRRSLLEQLGGLDEDFFAYADDTDLCLRAHLFGYQGKYVAQATGRHIGSATLGDPLHPNIVEFLTRNQILLVLKDYPLGTLLRLFPRIVVFQLLWMIRVILQRKLSAYLRGVYGALWLFARTIRKRTKVMRGRKIRISDFLAMLRRSEYQIYEWQTGLDSTCRSALLRAYFRLFGPPRRSMMSDESPGH